MTLEERLTKLRQHDRPTILRFLNASEQEIVRRLIPSAIFDGGYAEAERRRAYIHTDAADDIVAFRIEYPSRHLTLTHGNVLGTLMSLSLKRDTIGDILADQGIVFVTSDIAPEMERSFTAISQVPITLTRIDGRMVHRNQQFIAFEVIVSSLRLDTVVARIAGVPRPQAQDMIQTEQVQINHRIVSKPTLQLTETDILSIRRYGRFVVDDTSRRTKKDNIVLRYRKYA